MQFLTLICSLLLSASSIPTAAKFDKRNIDAGLGARDSICPNKQDLQPLLVIGYFEDQHCQNQITSVTYQACADFPIGTAGCNAAGIGTNSSVYAKLLNSTRTTTQGLLTRDQVCPPGGAGAVIATFNAGSASCLQIQGLTGKEGMAIYPNGGSKMAKRAGKTSSSSHNKKKNDEKSGEQCSGFIATSSKNTFSPSKQVSEIVNCQNNPVPCVITAAVQKATTLTSSFTLSSGIAVFGINVVSSLGQSYTDMTSTSISESLSVPVNQEGYLSVYSQAVLFEGIFTGCDNGPQQGHILALKKNTQTYAVVLTGS